MSAAGLPAPPGRATSYAGQEAIGVRRLHGCVEAVAQPGLEVGHRSVSCSASSVRRVLIAALAWLFTLCLAGYGAFAAALILAFVVPYAGDRISIGHAGMQLTLGAARPPPGYIPVGALPLVQRLAPYETGERGSGDPSRWQNERELEWVSLRPELVVEVTFDHSSGGRIRHGTKILRWRDDKAPQECRLEQMQS